VRCKVDVAQGHVVMPREAVEVSYHLLSRARYHDGVTRTACCLSGHQSHPEPLRRYFKIQWVANLKGITERLRELTACHNPDSGGKSMGIRSMQSVWKCLRLAPSPEQERNEDLTDVSPGNGIVEGSVCVTSPSVSTERAASKALWTHVRSRGEKQRDANGSKRRLRRDRCI
jgi:hypothetical protein